MLAADIISEEMNTPNFTEINHKQQDYDKARYLYVYFCHTHLNAGFPLIRRTLLVYTYPKTVYQVFGRMWGRRKEEENKMLLSYFCSEYERRVKDLKSNNIQVREYGTQLKIWN